MRHDREDGYILLDALVALLIVAIGFAAFLGAIGLAGSVAARQVHRIETMIEKRNADARDQPVLFQKE